VSVVSQKACLAKPFLKWAGGKGQLLSEIDKRLPLELQTGEIETYVEPFVGGGAVFFHIAQKYPALKQFYLFDINDDLVNCYNIIKEDVVSLVHKLLSLQDEFSEIKKTERKKFFLNIRRSFNTEKVDQFNTKTAAKLIFLNKTCFNGLYRVNRKGEFNVPFGDYENPRICFADNLRIASQVLQKAQIIHGDFQDSKRYINNHAFVYLDPPYRPLSPTAGFTSYSKENFGNEEQIRLAEFCKQINGRGAKFLLSNSDPKNENPNDHFFENKYKGFVIDRVKATRAINCKANGRGQINELIITNY
jgi:DNA adenine methylase